MTPPRRRVAFVVNTAPFFVSHRLAIAEALRARGDDVLLVTGVASDPTAERRDEERLASIGVEHRRVAFSAAGARPLDELRGLVQLVGLLRRWRPDIVHGASSKGALYAALAARAAGVPALVIAVTGLGSLFVGRARGRLGPVRLAYRALTRVGWGHRRKAVITQNADDRAEVLHAGLARPDEIVTIPGSGVDLARFAPGRAGHAGREALVVLPARMLRDKGIEEFRDAAARLRRTGCDWTFALVGTAASGNPTAVDAATLRSWERGGDVQWWGHRDDMPEILARASIVCLPSYREGLPKALLEAAAAGCAVVTTDVPGCREAIVAGQTGDLVPAHDAEALARAIDALIRDAPRRHRYGDAGRQLAERRHGIGAVVKRTLAVYDVFGDASDGVSGDASRRGAISS